MKPLQRRVMNQLFRARRWLDMAQEAYEKESPQQGEKMLEMATAELQLARETGRFWQYQKPSKRSTHHTRRFLVSISLGLALFLGLLALGGVAITTKEEGVFLFTGGGGERLQLLKERPLEMVFQSPGQKTEEPQHSSFLSTRTDFQLELQTPASVDSWFEPVSSMP